MLSFRVLFLCLALLSPSLLLADGYFNIPFRPINPEKDPDPWLGKRDFDRSPEDPSLPAVQYWESVRVRRLAKPPYKPSAESVANGSAGESSQEEHDAYYGPVSREEIVREVDRFFASGKYNQTWWFKTRDKTLLRRDRKLGPERMRRIDPLIAEMIEKNRGNYYITACGQNAILYADSSWAILFRAMSAHAICVAKKYGPEDACWLYEKTPALDPWTGKPYFSLPPATLEKLGKEDREYVRTVLDIVNENFHAYYGAPYPKLDMEKIRKGQLIGKFLNRKVLVTSQKKDVNCGVVFCRTDEEARNLFDRFLEKETELKRSLSLKLGRVCYHLADIWDFSELRRCAYNRHFGGSCTLLADYYPPTVGGGFTQTTAFTLPETDGSLNAMMLAWCLGRKATMMFCDWNALGAQRHGLKELLQENGVDPDAPPSELSPKGQALQSVFRQVVARIEFTQKAIGTIFQYDYGSYNFLDETMDAVGQDDERDRLFQKIFGYPGSLIAARISEGETLGREGRDLGVLGDRHLDILLRRKMPEVTAIFPYENLAKMLDAVGMASPERFTYQPKKHGRPKPSVSSGGSSSSSTASPSPEERLEELERALKTRGRLMGRDERKSLKDGIRELKKEIREKRKK